MKKNIYITLLILSFIIEIICVFQAIGKLGEVKQDTVKVNECVHSISENFGNADKYARDLDYVLLDNEGNMLYKTQDGLAETINEAIKNSDLILDINVDGQVEGKIIIHNDTVDRVNIYRNRIKNALIIICGVQLCICLLYFLYLKKTVTEPFDKLSDFAVRVAGGNLDLPLDMDKGHIFGSFTESFDIMRSELKKARIAEKKANDDKKEMIAKLSHDIKTPVASIKSTSEIGYELAKDERTKERFNSINIKSDQITALVDNLFNSAIQDINEIDVNPSRYEASVLKEIILTSDFQKKIKEEFTLPDCNLYFDKLRLSQAFDNVIMNSYKYAGTDIKVTVSEDEDYMIISVADFGEGVKPEEIPLLTEKYKRGSNTAEKEGAGLGLFLTKYFIEKMNGKLSIKNNNPGLEVKFYIRKM